MPAEVPCRKLNNPFQHTALNRVGKLGQSGGAIRCGGVADGCLGQERFFPASRTASLCSLTFYLVDSKA
eukprot:scaffold54224_cov18-Tisochrysis_lutea.AAC.2